jgi:hypothetical protein
MLPSTQTAMATAMSTTSPDRGLAPLHRGQCDLSTETGELQTQALPPLRTLRATRLGRRVMHVEGGINLRRILIAAAVTAAALAAAPAGLAASIEDLRALGYTVTIANPGAEGCPIYYATGFGNSAYFKLCDPAGQALVDSWANPVAHCNVKWEHEHPDQFAAVEKFRQKGYVVTGDECADSYTVTNRYTNKTIYTGKGADLPALADSVPDAQPAADGGPPAAPVVQASCLPLCAAPQPVPAPVEVVPQAAPAAAGGAPSAETPARAAAPTAGEITATELTSAKAAPASVNAAPLLTAAISHSLGRTIMVTSTTKCFLDGARVACPKLYGKLGKTRTLHVATAGKLATRVVLKG